MAKLVHEISRDIQVNDRFFHIHTEPSAAQKEQSMVQNGHDNPDPPWPWWAASDDEKLGEYMPRPTFSGGPYDTPDHAIAACVRFVDTGEGNNLKRHRR